MVLWGYKRNVNLTCCPKLWISGPIKCLCCVILHSCTCNMGPRVVFFNECYSITLSKFICVVSESLTQRCINRVLTDVAVLSTDVWAACWFSLSSSLNALFVWSWGCAETSHNQHWCFSRQIGEAADICGSPYFSLSLSVSGLLWCSHSIIISLHLVTDATINILTLEREM